MILSDRQLLSRGPYIVDPFIKEHVQPASIDLRLDDHFLAPQRNHTVSDNPIDLADVDKTAKYGPLQHSPYKLMPHGFVLASTIESVAIPNDLAGTLEGRSSLARLGLFVHVTAGWLDPGFQGKITLEVVNINPRSIILHEGLRICQLALVKLTNPAFKPYGSPGLGSHYQNQDDVTGSRFDG